MPQKPKKTNKKSIKIQIKTIPTQKKYISKTLYNNVLTQTLQKKIKKNLSVQNKVVYLHQSSRNKHKFNNNLSALDNTVKSENEK
jgi:hypothetical protein